MIHIYVHIVCIISTTTKQKDGGSQITSQGQPRIAYHSLSLSLYTHTHTYIYMYKTYVTFSTNTHIIHDMVWYGMIYIFFLSLFIFLLPFVNV